MIPRDIFFIKFRTPKTFNFCIDHDFKLDSFDDKLKKMLHLINITV